jgi:hypothetical protein
MCERWQFLLAPCGDKMVDRHGQTGGQELQLSYILRQQLDRP